MKPSTAFTSLCLTILTSLPVGAQSQVLPASTATPSLGDLARQQKLKREKAFVKPKAVFTNDNLPTRPAQEGPTAASTMSSGGASPPATRISSQSSSAEGTPDEPSKSETHGEAYFRAKAKELQARLDLHQRELSVLEQKSSQNQMQFYTDPNKTLLQEYSRADINKLTSEVDRKKAQIDADQKAIDDLRTQLRHDGGDPGWLR